MINIKEESKEIIKKNFDNKINILLVRKFEGNFKI
jgi:hypothetical protein